MRTLKRFFRISNIVATFKNGTIEAQNVAFEIAGASGLSNNAVTFAEDLNIISENDVAVFIYDSIVLNTSANITAKNAAIMGNGQDARFPKINVLDGNITSTDAAALYLPQKSGTTTISGGTITGTTGIEIRNGTLNITGGKIVATGETLTEAPNGNGNTVLSGAAVAVSKYANTGTLKVNISGGELEGVYTVYEKNLNADGAQIDGSSVNLSITDGKLSGEIHSDNKAGFISGGNYSELPKAEYFAEGFVGVWDEEAQAYVTQEGSYVATIDGYGYLTLDAAINSIGATETAEIVLLQDIYLDKDWSEIETIPGGGYYFYLIQQGQNITIELNGHTLEAKYPEGLNNMLGYFFNMGTLTLKDSVGGGAMIDNSHPDMKNPMTIVLNVGTLTFESGSYRAAATFTSLSGTVTIRGGTFDSVSNGGILVAGGVLNILPDEGKEVQINAALGIRGISECEVNIGGGNFVGAPVEDMMNKNDITPDMEGKIVSVMILEKCTVNIYT